MRTFSALTSLVVLILASWWSVFREAEGYLNPNYCLLIAFVGASLLIIFSWRTTFRQSGVWFALLLFGQGLSLQLIDAGPHIHYQHYRVIHGISTTYDAALVALLVLQTMVVILGFRHRVAAVNAWIARQFGIFRAMILFGAIVALSAFPSRDLQGFMLELLFSTWIIIIQLGCLVLGLMAVPPASMSRWNKRISGFLAGSGRHGSVLDPVAIICAVWICIVAVLLATFSYEKHPHSVDELSYIYQSNYFSEGLLYSPLPPVPEAFEAHLVDCDSERCISPVPPGWSVVLALGALYDVHWLINPVLAGINAILLFSLLHLLYDRYTARLGVLLLSASPWYLLMSMSFMNHVFSLTCALLAALSVTQMHRHRNAVWGVPGGLAIGMLSLTRPLEGPMVACTLGVAALFIQGRRLRLAPFATLTLSSMLGATATLIYNRAMTGDPFRFPIMAYADKGMGAGGNALGFGAGRGADWGGIDPFPGHGLPDVIVNALLNLDAMNIELFGWAVGSLLPLLLLFFLLKSGRLGQVDRWMLVFTGVNFGFQSLYWFAGAMSFGARYYFLAIIPLIALTVRAVRYLEHHIDATLPSGSRGQGAILMAVLVLCSSALINFLPWRAIDKYHHYRDMRPDIRKMIAKEKLGPVLLLISGKRQPDLNSAMAYSAIDPYGNEPIVAWDKNPSVRRRLLEAYPDRQVYLIDGPSITGAGYRVTAGPVSSAKLLQ